MKKQTVIITALTLALLSVLACRIEFQDATPTPQPTYTPQPTATLAPPPTATSQPVNIPAGWQSYQNSTYGFSISFPAEYQALDDAENLYGWPNGALLLYNAGQSYDIAIQVWQQEQDAYTNYPNAGNFLKVYSCGNHFISIFDITQEPENAAVINTFIACQD